MRRNLFAVLAVCFLLTAFSACKKDDKGSAGNTGGTYMTTIDGNTVKGTFSGKVAVQSGATTVAVADITDGEFSAPFK